MTFLDGAIRTAQTPAGTMLFVLAVASSMASVFLLRPWKWAALATFAVVVTLSVVLAWRARGEPS